jgi:hypothetical protein
MFQDRRKPVIVPLGCLPLLVPLALPNVAGCTAGESSREGTGTIAKEIIGGFPARSSRFDAIGALGFRIGAPPGASAEDPLAQQRHRAYVNPYHAAQAGDTYFPYCSSTLIAPNAVLTAEHCVTPLYGDEEFLIGFDGTQPARSVPIVGAMVENSLSGGFVGLGSDVAVAFLAEEITDIEPIAWGSLVAGDVGSQFVGFGYGVRNNDMDAGQRYLGGLNLRGIGGNHADNLFGGYDGFVEHYPELGFPYPPEDVYPLFALLDEHEASFGHAPGNAQDCFGDSGGPFVRLVGEELTTYGVVSGGVGSLELVCDWGGVASVFGPVAANFINRSLACPMVPDHGRCSGSAVIRCAPPAEGGWTPVETDCSLLGLVCGQDDAGELGCVVDPCEGIPDGGMCAGEVAIRCSGPGEGPRRVIETDCAVLGASCGSDTAGQLTCIGGAGPALSCAGTCGGSVESHGVICYCDSFCQDFGDCCDDYLDHCEPGNGGMSLRRRSELNR